MPRNMENASRLQEEWRERTMSCQIKVRKDSGIMEALESAMEALESACEKQNIKQSEYLRLAVAERLEEEGYETGYKTSSTNNA
jgi:hypothetical protein